MNEKKNNDQDLKNENNKYIFILKSNEKIEANLMK